jgi:hypothetical protein
VRPSRGDLLAIGIAALFIGALFALLWQPPAPAAAFELRVGGTLQARHALTPDRDIRVDGRIGELTLRVANGRVRFLRSSCRNQVCVHSGWLAHRGDAAACMPNRVSLSLVGGAADGIDAVGY